ncbi:MAG: ferrochelatase [Proteobacteria bacterium]|nr:ferrochelatase [Pseudomonadota bacterium]
MRAEFCVKLAVVLFNLGGPAALEEVEPFLRNLFSDPAIIALPSFLRLPIARLIAARRTPIAREIYSKIGGRSPILEETEAQARALEKVLATRGYEARAFIAMRYAKPFSAETARAVEDFAPERTVLLPLYPQHSTTTSASSLGAWREAVGEKAFAASAQVCCYPWEDGFVTAVAGHIEAEWRKRKPDVDYRLLLSAHGLPKRTVQKGDPYRWQVEKTAQAVVDRLGIRDLDWVVCYQSRVGPLEWIGPATDGEIRRAGAEGKGLVVAPIAFVSEHSETLVELDIEYAKLSQLAGVPDYLRAATAGTHPAFIEGLAGLVERALSASPATCGTGRICPAGIKRCGFGEHAS